MNWLILLAQIGSFPPLPPLPMLPPLPAISAQPAYQQMQPVQPAYLNQNVPVTVIHPNGTTTQGTAWSTQTPGTIGGGVYYKEIRK